MTLRESLWGGLLVVAGLLRCTALAAPLEPYPLDEIRPGLRATVWTVFSGVEPDSFVVEVVDRVPGTSAGSDVVLVRALDERLRRLGIAQGMSGSPVVADGRLIGALAFAFAQATEPIAGVTPFEEMATTLGPAFDDLRSAEPDPRQDSGGLWPDAQLPSYPQWRALCAAPGALAERLGSGMATSPAPYGLTRLLLPLLCDDAARAAAGLWTPLWQRCGLCPVTLAAGGGGAVGAPSVPRPLRPGDALSVDLVAGDMRVAAIGTVTWVDGDRVWAFGHPFLFGGEATFPVSRARIHTIVPTREVSFKVGSALESVGAIVADRRPGVAVRLGRRAATIPLDVRVFAGEQSSVRRYHFDVARHALLTPGLLAMAAASALSAQQFELRVATLASDLAVTLDDGRVVRRHDLFRSLSVAQTIAGDVMTPVSYLAISPYEAFPVAAVDLELRLHSDLRAANVTGVRVMQREVRPGDELVVEILLQRHMGGVETRSATLQVPTWVRGERLLVMAGSVAAFTDWDQERAPEKYHVRNQEDLLRLIAEFPSDESLIVRLYGASRGVVLRGRELAGLPVSKWHALSRSVVGGEASVVEGATLDEEIIPTGAVILGGSAVEVAIAR